MTTTSDKAATQRQGLERPEIRDTGLLRQSMTIVRRNLIHIKRMPEMLMDVTIQPVMFTVLFPITFLANTFAPAENMPTVLRVFAEWNPISSLVLSMRELWGTPLPPQTREPALPLQHPVLATIIWVIVITAVCAPLALRAFRRRTQG